MRDPIVPAMTENVPKDITMASETEETVLDPRSLVKALLQAHDDWSGAAGTPLYGEAADALNKAEAAVVAALSRAPEALELGSSTRMTSPASRSPEPLSAGGEQTDEYRVWMEPLPANPGGFALEGGWYGRPSKHIGMDNRGIWWRTTEDRALVMTRKSAIAAVKAFREKGYHCRCDPPITVTVTY